MQTYAHKQISCWHRRSLTYAAAHSHSANVCGKHEPLVNNCLFSPTDAGSGSGDDGKIIHLLLCSNPASAAFWCVFLHSFLYWNYVETQPNINKSIICRLMQVQYICEKGVGNLRPQTLRYIYITAQAVLLERVCNFHMQFAEACQRIRLGCNDSFHYI